MKRHLLIFIFILSSTIGFTQNWIGTYSNIPDTSKGINDLSYSLVIGESEIRAYQYSFTLEVSGMQVYYKIKGHVSETPGGLELEFFYFETLDGGFFMGEELLHKILFTFKVNPKGQALVYWNPKYAEATNGKVFFVKNISKQ